MGRRTWPSPGWRPGWAAGRRSARSRIPGSRSASGPARTRSAQCRRPSRARGGGRTARAARRPSRAAPSAARPPRPPGRSAAGRRPRGHVDAVRVLGEPGDPVAEDVLDTVPGVVVEHPGQVPAQDLDLRDVPVAAVVVRAWGRFSSTFASTSTVYAPAVSVRAARTAASSPIRRMTSLVTPRASTACPPGRSPGARSTTVTPAPRRRSQWARAGPRHARPRHHHLGAVHSAPRSPVRITVRIAASPTAPARR